MRALAVVIPLLCLVAASAGASQEVAVVPPPEWTATVPLRVGHDARSLQSGTLTLSHDPENFRAFELLVRGKRMAIGQSRPLVGYLQGDLVRWFAVHDASGKKVEVREQGGGLTVSASFDDPAAGICFPGGQRMARFRYS